MTTTAIKARRVWVTPMSEGPGTDLEHYDPIVYNRYAVDLSSEVFARLGWRPCQIGTAWAIRLSLVHQLESSSLWEGLTLTGLTMVMHITTLGGEYVMTRDTDTETVTGFLVAQITADADQTSRLGTPAGNRGDLVLRWADNDSNPFTSAGLYKWQLRAEYTDGDELLCCGHLPVLPAPPSS